MNINYSHYTQGPKLYVVLQFLRTQYKNPLQNLCRLCAASVLPVCWMCPNLCADCVQTSFCTEAVQTRCSCFSFVPSKSCVQHTSSTHPLVRALQIVRGGLDFRIKYHYSIIVQHKYKTPMILHCTTATRLYDTNDNI
jgi:hypothetical protein